MTHHGIVIPVNPAEPVRGIDYKPKQLLPVLYQEIGCTLVQPIGPLTSSIGELTIWADEEGLLIGTPVLNRRAMGLCRELRLPVGVIFGTVVLTGAVDEHGESLGLEGSLRRRLLAAFGVFVPAVPLR